MDNALIQKAVEKDLVSCPFCGSPKIGMKNESHFDKITMYRKCYQCNKAWTMGFQLTEFTCKQIEPTELPEVMK